MPIAAAGGSAGGGLGGAAANAVSSVAPAATAPVVASAAPVASSGGGLGSFLGNMHPMVQSQLISGIGSGLAANADAKDARRERERIEANYADTSGLFFLDGETGPALPDAGAYYSPRVYGNARLRYDPRHGRVVAGG